MAQPVWVLSVDLQTKTATFQSGMAEAAKSARGAFTDIKSGSGEMGREVSGNMMEARHGVMILAEEFGIHLPRALTSFIASIGPIGAAMEAAFPFLAIALGATLLIEHLVKMHEAGEKLTEDQLRFATSVQTAFNSLDEKLLQAGIRADELRNDHMGALKKQLELIDMQSMAELAHQFDELAKSSDGVFAGLQAKWYSFSSGSAGAQNSLKTFKAEYEGLLAKQDDKGATALLDAKIERETRLLALQKQAQATKGNSGPNGDSGRFLEHEAALVGLKEFGADFDKKAIASQEELLAVLNAQVGAAERVSKLKETDSSNAKTSAAEQRSSETAGRARSAIESQLRMGEMVLAADRATANARLTITRASIEEREQSDKEFAQRELDIQRAANTAQIAALDRLAKDYPNQLKALHEKAEELQQQHETTVTEITAKAETERAAKDLAELQQGEREKIEATQQASSARLSAIDAAIAEEEAKGLQDTAFYRDLLTQRVENVRKSAEEEARLKAEAGREVAAHDQTMAELRIAAEREFSLSALGQATMSGNVQLQAALELADEEYEAKKASLNKQLTDLDQFAIDYENKKKSLNDKLIELDGEHDNKTQQLNDQAEERGLGGLTTAQAKMAQVFSQGFSQVLMGKESFARMMQQFDSQVVGSAIQAALMSVATLDFGKERKAASAARDAFVWGWDHGGIAAPVLAPALAAGAFTAAMAFADGGVVPGVGKTDSVHAMLTPGEGIIPGSMMDSLRKMVGSGEMGGSKHYHAHVMPTYNIQALDTDGMETVLEKHSDTIAKHVGNQFRKLNRG